MTIKACFVVRRCIYIMLKYCEVDGHAYKVKSNHCKRQIFLSKCQILNFLKTKTIVSLKMNTQYKQMWDWARMNIKNH